MRFVLDKKIKAVVAAKPLKNQFPESYSLPRFRVMRLVSANIERWECKIYPYQSYKSKRVFHS